LARGASSGSIVAEAHTAVPLTAEGVFAGYGASRGQSGLCDVLSDITLSIAAGELVVVIGPNGAGKSTLLRVLSGTLRPRVGVARLFGSDLSKLGPRDIARRVAFVSQATEVAFGYRVEQVVMMGRSPHQGGLQLATKDDVDAAHEAMDKTGTRPLAARPLTELSGGEQKLVALARAFAQRPEVLLLDEPSAHLDPRHSIGVFELVISEVRARGLACVAIAHDLNLAAAFADRIVLIQDGRIRANGTVEEVMTPEHLTEVFGVELRVEDTAAGRCFVPRRRRPPDTRPSSEPDL
jgi:iron complex transport system ATP-binding protein